MSLLRKNVVYAILVALAFMAIQPAVASAPFQGIYVIVDPYNPADIKNLTGASTIACAGPGANTASPFCGATSGILLRTGWCSFQLYHVAAPSGASYPSCHYQVGFSNGANSPGQQIYASDLTSPCKGKYDICKGSNQSVLGSTLALVVAINAMRATAQLPPLQISLGLSAGVWTPQTVLDSVSYVDVPDATNTGQVAQNRCVRLPLVWQQSFTSAYNNTLDEFLSYVIGQLAGQANITILKSSGINADDLELEVPGRAQTLSAPPDPGPAGPGALLKCSTKITGAQTWLNAYNAAPNGKKTFSQANEWAFGTLIGHASATLANKGIASALLSIPTTGASGFANVDCGATGALLCTVTANSGNWPLYYFELYVDDLFDGGLAATAANAAYQAIRAGSFALPAASLAVNWTGLSNQAIVASQQVPCTLNNTNPAHAPSQKLNGLSTQLLGAGTTIGWQTQAQSGKLCASGAYKTTMDNGIANGGLFDEVQPDAAFTDLNQCSAPLTAALGQIQALKPPTSCAY